jgi:hypothetical protein|nr:MAG TPA: hypothetical protein [Bacteriophage sp.]
MDLENLLVTTEEDTFEQDLLDLSSLLIAQVYDDETEQLYSSIRKRIISQLNFKEFSASRILADIRNVRHRNVKNSLILEELIINPLTSYSELRRQVQYVKAGNTSNFNAFGC